MESLFRGVHVNTFKIGIGWWFLFFVEIIVVPKMESLFRGVHVNTFKIGIGWCETFSGILHTFFRSIKWIHGDPLWLTKHWSMPAPRASYGGGPCMCSQWSGTYSLHVEWRTRWTSQGHFSLTRIYGIVATMMNSRTGDMWKERPHASHTHTHPAYNEHEKLWWLVQMDPETVVLVGAGTGDMKMLNIGLCMQMSDYKTCIQQALTLSCSLNQRESVLKLISAGSHPTNCDLSAASRNGHYDLVKTLLALPGAQ